MPTFLVPLWLCAIYLSDIAAAVLGLVWIVGRALYFAGYSKAVEKRLPGFFIQSTGACAGVLCTYQTAERRFHPLLWATGVKASIAGMRLRR
jgi:hypothetical protein